MLLKVKKIKLYAIVIVLVQELLAVRLTPRNCWLFDDHGGRALARV